MIKSHLGAAVTVFSIFIGQAFAQTSYDAEYMKRLKLYQTVQPLGPTPFGEDVNLYTGELSFTQVDIELPGIGPTIVLSRTVGTQYQYWAPIGTMGDWQLNIPRIETMVSTPGRFDGGTPGLNWKVEVNSQQHVGTLARCTQFNIPYDRMSSWALWWQGYDLITETGSRQILLQKNPAAPVRPQLLDANGTAIAVTGNTIQNWQLGCLPATTNGEPGEGFVVVSPEGTRYHLTHLVGIPAAPIIEVVPYLSANNPEEHSAVPSTPGQYDAVPKDTPSASPTTQVFHTRMLVAMYVSRVEDRFGNYLTYQYDGKKLVSINASDGRHVDLTWDSNSYAIESITVTGTPFDRTWIYGYGQDGRLASVRQPDSNYWYYNLPVGGGLSGFIDSCGTRNVAQPTIGPLHTGTVTHPSGLVGTFSIRGTYHGRSYVDSTCKEDPQSHEVYEEIPPIFSTPSLVGKSFSGTGLPTQNWSYVYSPVEASASHDACAQNNSCPEARWVDMTDTDGDRTRYTLSTQWGPTEGKLLKTEQFAGASTLKRTETVAYAPVGAIPNQSLDGISLFIWGTNTAKSDTFLPERHRIISQDNRVFTWEVATDCASGYCLDAFARPTKILRSSRPAP